MRYRPPRTALYLSVTAARFPADPAAVRRLVADQWSHPVRFREAIEAMHAEGVRIFVEAGLRGLEEPDGRVVAAGSWARASPVVSLVARDGAAVAVAGHCRGIALALGHLTSDDTDRTREHPLVAALDEPLCAEWALRLRCAGEAAAALTIR